MEENKKLLRVSEVARLLDINVVTLYNWVNEGRIPFKKIGRCIRLDWDEINKVITKGKKCQK